MILMFFSRCSGDSVAGPPRERSCSQVKDTVPVPVVNLIPGKDGRVSEKTGESICKAIVSFQTSEVLSSDTNAFMKKI